MRRFPDFLAAIEEQHGRRGAHAELLRELAGLLAEDLHELDLGRIQLGSSLVLGRERFARWALGRVEVHGHRPVVSKYLSLERFRTNLDDLAAHDSSDSALVYRATPIPTS